MSSSRRSARLDFNSAYKTIRNKFRAFRPASMIGHVLKRLHYPTADEYSELKKIPWQQLLLVKWVCQDSMTSDRTGRPPTDDEFDMLRQRMWDLPEIADLGIRDSLPHYLFMRQLLRPQIGFQRKFTSGFVREAALLASVPESSSLPTLFMRKTGLRPREFLDLSLATYTAMAEERLAIPLGWHDPLRSAYGDRTIDNFISTISLDYQGLRAFFRSLPGCRERYASEYFEFPVVARYPFLRENNQLICWHRMVFNRGIEGLVHAVMSEAGQEYMGDFSRLFEGHVTSLVRELRGAAYYGEMELQEMVPTNTKVPDALLSFPECNIFVESKAGLFDESVMAVGHNEMFKHKTRMIRKAISQGWSVSSQLRRTRRAPTAVLKTPTDYLLVVTNKDLSASRGTVLAGIYPEGTLDYPDEDAERFLPLEHVYVVTIEEFERLMMAAQSGAVSLPQVMQHCVTWDQDPASASYYFEQHLSKLRVPRASSSLVTTAIDEAAARLARALGGEAILEEEEVDQNLASL